MMSNKYGVFMKNHGETIEDCSEFGTIFGDESLGYVADDACKHIYYNCNGWEWMGGGGEFTLCRDGKVLGDFTFTSRVEPTFRCTAKKEEGND